MAVDVQCALPLNIIFTRTQSEAGAAKRQRPKRRLNIVMFCTLAMFLLIFFLFRCLNCLVVLTSLFHKTNGAFGYDVKTAIFCGGSVVTEIISDGDDSCDVINNQGDPENIAFCQCKKHG